MNVAERRKVANTLAVGTAELLDIEAEHDQEEKLAVEMNRTVIRLKLLQHGNTMSFGVIGGGHASSKPPSGDSHPLVDQLVFAYRQALSNVGRRAVLKRAENELAAIRKKRAVIADEKSIDQCVIDDGVGYPAKLVAERYGLAENHVRRIRQRAGRIADDGTLPPEADLTRDERRREARRMRNAGMSIRQIAMSLRVSKTLICADLKATS